MPRYQVEVTVSQNGYLEFEAKDEADARRIARGLEPEIVFNFEGIDDSLFDRIADLRIDGVELDEEEKVEASK